MNDVFGTPEVHKIISGPSNSVFISDMEDQGSFSEPLPRQDFEELFPPLARVLNGNVGLPPSTLKEKSSDIDSQEAQQTLEIAEANLRKAEGKRQKIEANLALRRARTRVETINSISELVGVSE